MQVATHWRLSDELVIEIEKKNQNQNQNQFEYPNQFEYTTTHLNSNTTLRLLQALTASRQRVARRERGVWCS